MAKKEMIVSTCDRCEKEVMHDFSKRLADIHLIPEGWLHVSGNTRLKTIFELDLCEVCKVDVLNAAGEHRS